jgi:rod shape-determining protein MreB
MSNRARLRRGLASVLSDDIAIDLGTANTLVHVVGRGVIIDEPSLVALVTRNARREVLAVGQKVREIAGRTPERIDVIRPLRDGVIADFVATEAMLRDFIRRSKSMTGLRRPRILICVPAGATPVERRAVHETAASAGARAVYMIEEPVAAALGAGLPVDEAAASMVIDIGGGTTDIAVLADGGVVSSRSLRLAGNAMDEAIVRHVRRHHDLLIGEASAERIKIEAGSASRTVGGRRTEIHIRGRELKHGRLKSIVLGPADVAEALQPVVAEMGEFILRALDDLPGGVAREVAAEGVHLTGGGAMLRDLDCELERRVGVRFLMPEQPMQCVVRGSAKVLEELDLRRHLLIGA